MGLLISTPLWVPVWAQAPPDALAQISALKCKRADRTVSASFRVSGALGPEELRDLESGITITFTHTLHLVRRRKLFFDKSLGKREIETTATLDTLTQQYTLKRTVDGGAVEVSTTDRRDVAERWLADIRNQSIEIPPGNDQATLELRVSTEYRKNWVIFIWPSSISAVGSTECR